MEIVAPFLIRFLQFPFEMSCPDFAMPTSKSDLEKLCAELY